MSSAALSACAPTRVALAHTVEPSKYIRQVLIAVRNFTTFHRVLDLLRAGLLSGLSTHIQFVIDSGSRFASGLAAHIAKYGHSPLGWREAASRQFDLVLSAHASVRLAELSGPLLQLPHGVGHPRLVPHVTGDQYSPSGIARRQLVRNGVVVPTVIGVTHQDQLRRLAETCPEAASRAFVVGDVLMDQMSISRQRRNSYRQALGVRSNQILVVVSSTWGPYSTLARAPRLPFRIVSQPDAAKFVVASVNHWNDYLMRADKGQPLKQGVELDRRLIPIPPTSGWQAAILACDVVIGDHGSVSFYAAALGRPLILSGGVSPETDRGSSSAKLQAAARRLDQRGDLVGQILRAIDDPKTTKKVSGIARRSFGVPGQALHTTRDIVCRLMRLPTPTERVVQPGLLPLPTEIT